MRYRIRADGGNLSSARHEVRVRTDFERRLALRNFLAIDRARQLADIFPEAASLGYPLDDRLVPFLLAMLGLQDENRDDALHIFAADLLMDLMQDPQTRSLVWEKAGFTLPDLFRVVGNIDPHGAERMRRRANSLERQLNDLVQSRTWRVARRLRDLTSGMRALFDRR
jgi:hypothetical protein